MTKGIFITAVGTDIGKTFISALIVKKLRESGYNCGYYKPVLSGAEKIDGKLTLGDCEYVIKTAGIDANPFDYVSYYFEPAVSPHLASQMENNPIKLTKIISDFEKIKRQYDYLAVEGAGGIVCPFGENLLLSDVIKALNLDIIIVSNSSLGSINSAFLTADYAKRKGINIQGIILNNYDEKDFMQADNKKQIEKLTGVNVIAEIKKGESNIADLSGFFKEI